MSEAEEQAMDMLFRAKWNIPQAVVAMGLAATEDNWRSTKKRFADYCHQRPIEHRFIDD